MNLAEIKSELRSKYKDKSMFENQNIFGETIEVLCEVEPTSDHEDYSKAIAIIDRSKPHFHKHTKETYKIVRGKLRLFLEGELIEMEEGDEYEIPNNKIHWAYGDETWIECYSEPGWKFEDHLEVNWLKLLFSSLPSEYKAIWEAAWDLQDSRDDLGHAEVVTSFALQIAKSEHKVTKDIAVIAAILHDIGWSKLNKTERMLIFDKSIPKEDRLKMRFKHQDEGVKIAREILKNLEYDESAIAEVCEIISEHDTRKGFISPTEGAMRDADKLWRFTEYGFINDSIHSQNSIESHLNYLDDYFNDKEFFYFESSRNLAKNLLQQLKLKFLN